jgi:hypothetical protein
MVLDEQQDAARRVAGPEVRPVRPGQQLDRVAGDGCERDVRAARAVEVDLGERRRGVAPAGGRSAPPIPALFGLPS